MELPLQWAPVLVMLVHNHRHHIPQSAYTDWLQAVHSHSFEGDPEPAATFWLLRYLHELALAWPAALTAAEDDSHAAGDVSIAQLEGCWKVQTHAALFVAACLCCMPVLHTYRIVLCTACAAA